MKKVEMGQEVRDRITGFSGFVTGICKYITGCDQILVQPRVKEKDGDFVESRWVDDMRLVATGKKVDFSLVGGGSPAELFEEKEYVESRGADKPAPIK